jgi:1-acyl-sn-glycerol-3-phosphate acyltransferase
VSVAAVLALAGRLISGASVRWIGCEPSTRQRVYFANHSSHLDFLVLWSALPAAVRDRTRPVAARDYWENGRLRYYLATSVFHAILIERRYVEGQQNDAIDRLLEAIGERYSLILFPEGTRGREAEPARFRSGLFNLAQRRPDLELVPVYLRNLNRVLPKGEFLPVPLSSSVTFGPPIQVSESESREAFLERARESVVRLSRI